MSDWQNISILKPFRTNSISMPVIKFGSDEADGSPDGTWNFTIVNGIHTVSKDLYFSNEADFVAKYQQFYDQLQYPANLQSGNNNAIWQLDINPNNKIEQIIQSYNGQARMTFYSMKFTQGYFSPTGLLPSQDGFPYPFKWGIALFSVTARSGYNGNYMGVVTCNGKTNPIDQSVGGRFNITLYNIYDAFGTDLPIPTEDKPENPDYPDPSDGGGYDPDPDPTSDPVDIPDDPPIGFSNSGLYNVYKISNKALLGLASELFQDVDINFDGISGIEDTLKSIGDLLKNGLNMFINNNLIQFVLDCHILPCSPTTGTVQNIDIGFREFSQVGALVTSDYVTINCGTLNLKEYYSNYIDYLTKFDLVLPFIGTVPIEPEYIQNGSITVVYKFNVIDGSCVAFVKSTSSKSSLTDTVIGTYTGSCCVHLPITGQNYASMLTETLNGSLGALVTATGGNTHGAIANSLDVISSRPNLQSSNGYNATSSILGMRTPYLIIKRPVASFSVGYDHENGLPSNVYKQLSTLDGLGFTIIDKIDLNGLNLLDEERNELLSILQNGVYF